VAPQWSLGLIGATLLAAFAAISVLVIAHVGGAGDSPRAPDAITPAHTAPAALTVSIEARDDSAWSVSLAGPADRQVVISVAGSPVAMATLSDSGRASIQLPASAVGHVDTLQAALLGRSRTTSVPQHKHPEQRKELAAATPATPKRARKPRPTASSSAPRDRPEVQPVARSAATVAGPPNLLRAPDAGAKVALTFDGGAISRGANGLLHVLKLRGVRATLFLTGDFIRRETALVRSAIHDGHEVGNHTLDHPRLTTYATNRRHQLRPEISKSGFQRQLTEAERLLRERIGRPMVPLWRAPYGEENSTLRGWAFELGYLHARWSTMKGHSLDAWDWVEDEHSLIYEEPETMVQRLLSFPRLNGGIVLMHLGSRRETPSWTALPTLLDALEDRGLEVVPLTELLASSPTWSDHLAEARRRHRASFSRPPSHRQAQAPPHVAPGPQTSRNGPNLPTSPSAPPVE
jgi:peptidoglycan/xylan/chitin deacetylase (PgdA/CDA1 family)